MNPIFEGVLDGADCNSIWGWAWDPYSPAATTSVSIYKDGALYRNVSADLYRQDLYNDGIGNGYHAFSMSVPSAWRDGRWHYIQVKHNGSGYNQELDESPRWIICSVSMFTRDPDSEASGQGQTWEQATRFSSTDAGFVTYIRFYKHCSETGTHVGRLWTDTGTQLARVTFTNETQCGWQKAKLTPPIAISAGVKYRVSYNINSYVAKTWNVFHSPVTNGPLTAYGSFYSTPAGTFPTTGSISNLFADVVFNSPR
jgi:hypothetical protein